MSKRVLGLMLAAGALASVGCGAADESDMQVGGEDLDTSEQAISANPGICQNGMTTSLKKLHPPSDFGPQGQIPNSFSCTLNDVPEFVSYICKTDEKVCKYFQEVVAGHGKLQCVKYLDTNGQKKACVDVVDKDPLGNLLEGKLNTNYMMNFVIVMVDDNNGSPEVPYWNSQLPLYPNPPVSLSVAGYYYETAAVPGLFYGKTAPGGTVHRIKLLKQDPRECSSCGPYTGPNILKIEPWVDLNSFYPSFTSANCQFEKSPGSFIPLLQSPCNQEQTYRNTGR